ncbi:MAG: TlpA disulfide reductase family protein [Candidatus Omnitrophica bacterium]|nr:TlpA disulfide reductase family protein [Candidatus Omnitrophota bacterium]
MGLFKKVRVLISVILIFLVLAFFNKASAQDIILNDLNGKAVNLSSYKGRPTILFFWTTWCPYCREELKTLNQLYPQMKKEGITVFAVNVGEPSYAVRKFFVSHIISFGLLLDTDEEAANKYNVIGVPTYVFMTKSGQVISDEHVLPVDYKKLLFQ